MAYAAPPELSRSTKPRNFKMPPLIRVYTVPNGIFNRSEISLWEYPFK